MERLTVWRREGAPRSFPVNLAGGHSKCDICLLPVPLPGGRVLTHGCFYLLLYDKLRTRGGLGASPCGAGAPISTQDNVWWSAGSAGRDSVLVTERSS